MCVCVRVCVCMCVRECLKDNMRTMCDNEMEKEYGEMRV